MGEIDENDAPEGFKAVASTDSCTHCAFADRNRCYTMGCSAGKRPDKTEVIFIKKSK